MPEQRFIVPASWLGEVITLLRMSSLPYSTVARVTDKVEFPLYQNPETAEPDA